MPVFSTKDLRAAEWGDLQLPLVLRAEKAALPNLARARAVHDTIIARRSVGDIFDLSIVSDMSIVPGCWRMLWQMGSRNGVIAHVRVTGSLADDCTYRGWLAGLPAEQR